MKPVWVEIYIGEESNKYGTEESQIFDLDDLQFYLVKEIVETPEVIEIIMLDGVRESIITYNKKLINSYSFEYMEINQEIIRNPSPEPMGMGFGKFRSK